MLAVRARLIAVVRVLLVAGCRLQVAGVASVRCAAVAVRRMLLQAAAVMALGVDDVWRDALEQPTLLRRCVLCTVYEAPGSP